MFCRIAFPVPHREVNFIRMHILKNQLTSSMPFSSLSNDAISSVSKLSITVNENFRLHFILLEFKINKSTEINDTSKTYKHIVRTHNYNFCYSANMLNIRSHEFAELVTQRCSVKKNLLENL